MSERQQPEQVEQNASSVIRRIEPVVGKHVVELTPHVSGEGGDAASNFLQGVLGETATDAPGPEHIREVEASVNRVSGSGVPYKTFLRSLEAALPEPEEEPGFRPVYATKRNSAIAQALQEINGQRHNSYLGDAALSTSQAENLLKYAQSQEGTAARTTPSRDLLEQLEHAMDQGFLSLANMHNSLVAEDGGALLTKVPAALITSIKVGSENFAGMFQESNAQPSTLAELVKATYHIPKRGVAGTKEVPWLFPSTVLQNMNNPHLQANVSEIRIGQVEDGTLGLEVCVSRMEELHQLLAALMAENGRIQLQVKKLKAYSA